MFANEKKWSMYGDVKDLDLYVLAQPDEWAYIKKRWYEEKGTSRLETSGITLGNHLIYIRALSRVFVDLETWAWNKKNPDSRIYIMAAGSTNITSDYDVTMAGPRASELAAHINGKFFRDTGHSLSTYADTNLYFNPWVLITNNNFHRFAENFIHVPRPDEEDL